MDYKKASAELKEQLSHIQVYRQIVKTERHKGNVPERLKEIGQLLKAWKS